MLFTLMKFRRLIASSERARLFWIALGRHAERSRIDTKVSTIRLPEGHFCLEFVSGVRHCAVIGVNRTIDDVIDIGFAFAGRPSHNRDVVQLTIDLQHRQQSTSLFIVDPREDNDQIWDQPPDAAVCAIERFHENDVVRVSVAQERVKELRSERVVAHRYDFKGQAVHDCPPASSSSLHAGPRRVVVLAATNGPPAMQAASEQIRAQKAAHKLAIHVEGMKRRRHSPVHEHA
jgi:hypothetical protein